LFCSVNRTPGGISNRHLRDNGDSQRASRDAGKWTRHLAEMISCRTVEINSWAERLVQASHARHPASLMASASRTVDVAAYRAPLVDDRRNAKVSAEFWSTLHGSVPRRRCKSERAPYQKPERCPFQHLRIAVSIAGEFSLRLRTARPHSACLKTRTTLVACKPFPLASQPESGQARCHAAENSGP
jgi:hypothetical protein